MSSVITTVGRTRMNQLAGEESPLVIDRMVLAMIPELDTSAAADPDQQLPDESDIVYTYPIPDDYKGYVDADQVVYSMMLGTDIGAFSFNWIGLLEKGTDTVITVTVTPESSKWATDLSTNTTGNMVTRNVILSYQDAQNLTGISVAAETWQVDYQGDLNTHIALKVDPTGDDDTTLKHVTDTQIKICYDHLTDPIMHRGKNALINGNFDIWQRAESQTSNGYGSEDRWFNGSNTSTKTHSQQKFDLGQTNVPGNPKYFSRTVVTSVEGASAKVYQEQRIEGVETFSGGKATLSFYAKADAARDIAVEFWQYFGSSGSPSDSVTAFEVVTFSLTTEWQKLTATVDVPSIAAKTLGDDGNDYSAVRFWFDAGSDFDDLTNSLGQQNGIFDIAQVQLEAGELATDFERRLPGVELALCQRYYTRNAGMYGGYYYMNTAGSPRPINILALPVTMRTTPTITTLNDPSCHGTASDVYFIATPTYVSCMAATTGAGVFAVTGISYEADAEL